MDRISARYEGRVQGVGFRATARAIAVRHGLTGWVRNEPDGSVQLEAQGSSEAVLGLTANLRSEMGSFIRTVQVCAVPIREGESGFEIHR